jgi:ADP-ribose pyrophosphatase YjhB (NUDIX family)
MADYIQWLRSQIGHQKVPLVFTCAIIYNEAGEILWQQRSDFGWWGFPGGSVEMNENLTACLEREIHEETGLKVAIERLLGIYSSPDFDICYPNGDEAQQVTFTFVCRLSGGEMQADKSETLDLNWKPVNEIPETAAWYAAMLSDYRMNSPQVQFAHGSPGNNRIGKPLYQHIRQYIGKQAYIGVGAAAIVRDAGGRILLQHRSDTGLWGLPGGGMEIGERIDRTVIHEVKEETGFDVSVERLLAVYSDERFNAAYPNGDQVKVIGVIFECRITGGSAQPDGNESLAVEFFPVDALPPMAEHVKAIIEDAQNLNGGVIFK